MSDDRVDETLSATTEASLRQALAEHVPGDIDATLGWQAIVLRLALRTNALRGRRMAHLAWRWSPLGFVAAALAAVVLMGATYAGGHFIFGWNLVPGSEFQLIGDKHLYTDVNTGQTADGITITVAQAYADEGSTLIAYTIRLASGARASHPGPVVASSDLTDQYGEEATGADTICGPVSSDGRFIECLMDTTAFHPPAPTNQLDLTWTITKVYLFHDNATVERDGDWKLTFSLPFHHTSNGPGLSPAQPTRSS
jgi:hypothetical protein